MEILNVIPTTSINVILLLQNQNSYPAVLDRTQEVCEFQCVCAKSLQTRLTVWDPMICSPPGSSIHGILQARIQEWVAMPSSRGSSPPDVSLVSPVLAGRFFTTSATCLHIVQFSSVQSLSSVRLFATP